VLAVDGGNSKLDAVLLSRGGRVLGAARGRGASFSPHDHDGSFTRLDATVARLPQRRHHARPGPDRRCRRALPGRGRSAGGRPPAQPQPARAPLG